MNSFACILFKTGLLILLSLFIVGCAEDPVRFTQPGVEIWKLDITMGKSKIEIKDQKMILTPSETEKGVFSVLVEISADIYPPAGPSGIYHTEGSWKGEIRNGIFAAKTSRRVDCQIDPHSMVASGEVKGTVSGSRASGTIKEDLAIVGIEVYGKWTAEKIS
jgi:hypothetical protein